MYVPAFIAAMPKELAVFLISAAPIGELRVALPLGVTVFKMPYASVLFWSVLGSIVPVFLIYGLGNVWLRLMEGRQGFFSRLTDKVLHHARRKAPTSGRYGLLAAIAVIVGMPVPLLGGVWTGTLVAFILGIPLRRAFIPILLGILGMAAIISAFTLGAKVVF